MSSERLQKILSQAGYGSRREIERLIAEGKVRVNGKVAVLGDKATVEDRLSVDGKMVAKKAAIKPRTRILLYHKPIGEICSRKDPEHKKTVFDKLPRLENQRWVQVGRLDINTSGLLIFTNDGELANRLMHPRFGLEREYSVRVHGKVEPEMIKNLLKGVQLDDGPASFKRVDFQGGEGANSWYNVTLTEGRNREVRRLWQSQGVEVSRLIRIRYGKFTLPRNLSRGHSEELSLREVEAFLKSLNQEQSS